MFNKLSKNNSNFIRFEDAVWYNAFTEKFYIVAWYHNHFYWDWEKHHFLKLIPVHKRNPWHALF